ncbi:MAG TPA: N-acetylmuramoyl-L-alanine amidase [Rhodospirillales bacterium]|nr:N-acetylmuramoyl-L-alanine amidase [Rhodospirillales bacterium]
MILRPGCWFYSIALAVFLAFTGLSAVQAAETVVTGVRVGHHGQTTRLVFDLTNKVDFKIFALSKPYRIVIDLPEVGWRLPPRPLPVGAGMLKKLRYGLFQPGTSRIVLDVATPPSIEKSFILKPDGKSSYRLVVDLGKVSAADFASASKTAPTQKKQQQQVAVSPVLFSPPKAKPDMVPETPAKRVVFIDPGHGGVDPGTIGVSGTYEKHITLAMARELKAQLDKTGRIQAMLTRKIDIFVPLRERVSRAREAGAELFISIHADAIKNRKTRGLSIYTLSEKASDKEAAALADKENKADLIAGINLVGETKEVTNILIDLARRESMNQSSKFATGLVFEMRRQTKLLRKTHRFAGFAVLKAPDVPSVLIELGFLSNRSDEKALKDKKYRAKLAKGMVRAITGYFSNIEEAYKK